MTTGGNEMADKLVMCFYDGMSKENAIKFLETVYGKKVRDVSIKTATIKIKETTGKDW